MLNVNKFLRPVIAVLALGLVLAACSRPGTAPATPTRPAPTQVSDVAAASPVPPTTTVSPTLALGDTPTASSVPTAAPTATTVPPSAIPAAQAQAVHLKLQLVAEGLDRPVFVTHAGDGSGRLFIVEKPGVIRIWTEGRLLETPFLDIQDRVRSSGSEQGLLGLAFAPDYGSSGLFFVDYTDRQGDTVISRFRVTGDPNVADPASEFKVLGIDQPAANHNGGMLLFGPDGYLWVGTGDGGAANDRFGNGQNPETLLGKMLRLDVTSDPSQPYVIPKDNPWVAANWNGRDVRDEIWAVGLRNPWRYSFDRKTGDLWIADVGQDKYEEVDLVKAGPDKALKGGLNFGWPIMEGTHCFPDTAQCQRAGLEIPVADYSHAEGCSVTGGYVYRGGQIPALDGTYLFGDYCSGRIWTLRAGANGVWQRDLALESGLALSSFGEDESGELYVADLNGGRIYRLVAG